MTGRASYRAGPGDGHTPLRGLGDRALSPKGAL